MGGVNFIYIYLCDIFQCIKVFFSVLMSAFIVTLFWMLLIIIYIYFFLNCPLFSKPEYGHYGHHRLESVQHHAYFSFTGICSQFWISLWSIIG